METRDLTHSILIYWAIRYTKEAVLANRGRYGATVMMSRESDAGGGARVSGAFRDVAWASRAE